MPYTTEAERKWVATLTGGKFGLGPNGELDLETELRIKQQDQVKADLDRKSLMLTEARKVVEGKKTEMNEAFAFEIEVAGKKMKLLGENGDSTKAFDTDETRAITEPPSAGQLKRAHEALAVLAGQKEILIKEETSVWELADGKVVDTKKPLFSVDEVMKELYTPLVRELIIPDGMIENKYSQVQKMIDGSNDAYLKELESYEEPDALLEGLSKGKEVFELATSITKLAVSGGPELLKSVVELAEKVVNAGFDASTALIGKADPSKGVPTFATNVGGVMASIVTIATGDKALGKSISDTVGKLVTAGSTMGALLKQPEPDFDGFLTGFASSVANALGGAASGVESERTKIILGAIGKSLSTAAAAIVSSKKADFIENIKKGNWGKIASTVSGALLSAAGTGIDVKGELDQVGKDKTEKSEISETVEKEKLIVEQIDTLRETSEKIKEQLEEQKKAFEKEAEKWLKADQEEPKGPPSKEDQKKIQEKLEKEMEEQGRLLEQLKASDKEPDLSSIAKLIEKMKRDEAIMSAVGAVGKAGLEATTKFLSGFPATALSSFLTNLASAVQRAIHLRKWLDANNDAISAVSPYKTAIENFVKNQAEQFSHKSIQAAINVLQAGAGFAGMAVPFAAPIAAGLSVAASAEELIYKFYKESSLKAAWAKTQQALENPGNRKLALIARKMNPTLAKYTIAYGALIDKDVVAITAMNRCGLSRETLADKSTNVGEVKNYLETLYPDDGKALGEYDDGDWRKKLPAPALDVMNWSLAYETAKKSGGPQETNPRPVVGQLKTISQLEATLQGKPKESDYEALASALKSLLQAISALKPGDAKAKEFFGRYVDLVEIRLAEVEQARADLFDLQDAA